MADPSVELAIQQFRKKEVNRNIPDEWWNGLAEGLSDSRCYYLGGYNVPSYSQAIKFVEDAVSDWHEINNKK